MYLNGNNGFLGAGLADYSLSINQNQIANLLRNKVMEHFNNPHNYKLSPTSQADGTYGKSFADGSGWKYWPSSSAPGQNGPQSLKAAISGEHGNYYRVPNSSQLKWVNKNNFSRLSQAEITQRISSLANNEVLIYLKGKQLAWIAANLPTAINAVVAKVKSAINAAGSWFQAWGLSV